MKKLISSLSVLFLLSLTSYSYSQNQSLSFDGVDDWFIVNPYLDLNLGTSDFTIEAMVNVTQKSTGLHTILTNNNLAGVFIRY